MKKVVSRVIETSKNGSDRLDKGLTLLGGRENIVATQFATAPTEDGGCIVKVQCTIVILPNAQINEKTWFTSLTERWLIGCHVKNFDDVKVRNA